MRENPNLETVQIRAFEPGDEIAFRTLNEEWIARYFRIEEKDRVTLGDPVAHILKQGGGIAMAAVGNVQIGCCALIAMEPGVFEVAKMAVTERYRGNGIGRKILEFTIEQAKTLGANRLYLETNSGLANAIHLYESLGFRHLPAELRKPSIYSRADVFMEMPLTRAATKP